MTEPTEADFAAYDAARERAHAAYWIYRMDHSSGPTPEEFYRREFAQAIAEARAQGETKMREWCTSFVEMNCDLAMIEIIKGLRGRHEKNP
jgi:hypothetical protein